MRAPSYDGGGLVNLIAEIERRLSGTAPTPGLHPDIASLIPDADTYVVVLFDGLGDHQVIDHPSADELSRHRVGALDTCFSSQTSVATATLATGLPPSQHGLISYLVRLSDSGPVVNTLWWFATDGSIPGIDLQGFLPSPNLAERLGASGAEAVVVQPDTFLGGPLDRVLHRGGRTRGVPPGSAPASDVLDEAARPGRLVVCYLPQIDAAGHVEGTRSQSYADALAEVTAVWSEIGAGLPDHAVMVGTADHGMIDVEPDNRVQLDAPNGLVFHGDDRVVYVSGDPALAEAYAAGVPGRWMGLEQIRHWWGPGPHHPQFELRAPDGVILADDGVALHYPGNHVPMVGYHGGVSEAELRIPLLVWT